MRFMVSAISIMLAVMVSSGCSPEKSESELLISARTYFDTGLLIDASIELKSLLAEHPNNADARRLLGTVYLGLNQYRNAEKELRLAAGLVDEADDVHSLLAQALLPLRSYLEVISFDSKPLRGLAKIDLLSSQALALHALGRAEEAWNTQALAERLQSNEEKVSVYMPYVKALLFSIENKLELARAELVSVFEVSPNYPAGWTLLGDIERRSANYSLSEQAYTKALESPANPYFDRLKRAEVRLLQQKTIEAGRDLDILLKRDPNNPLANHIQGLIHYYEGRFIEAKQAFDKTLLAFDSNIVTRYFLALTHQALGNPKQATAAVERFLGFNPNSVPGLALLASLQASEGFYVEAEETLRPIVDESKNAELLRSYARLLVALGRFDEGVAILKRGLLFAPENIQLTTDLAEIYLYNGSESDGINMIESSINQGVAPNRSYISLAGHYIRQSKFSEATTVAQKFLSTASDEWRPYMLLGRISIAQDDNVTAKSYFLDGIKHQPSNPDLNHALASLAIYNENYEFARKYYLAALNGNPNNLDTLMRFAALELLTENHPKMLSYLDQARRYHPDDAAPVIQLGRYYLSQQRFDRLTGLINELPTALRETAGILSLRIENALHQQAFLDAESLAKKLLRLNPDSYLSNLTAAKVFSASKQQQLMIKHLDHAVKIQPEKVDARIILARNFIAVGEIDKANKHIATLNISNSEHPDVVRLNAFKSASENNLQSESQFLAQLYNLNPDYTNLVTLIKDFWSKERTSDAIGLLENWISTHPQHAPANLLLAELYKSAGDFLSAEQIYLSVLKFNPKSAIALNELAWMYRDEKTKESLEYALKATAEEPDASLFQDTLAIAYLRNGEHRQAQITIEKARLKSPDNLTLAYHDALISAESGEKEIAVEKLKLVLSTQQDFPELEDAKDLYSSLSK